jgi:arsenite-transporting ATPase
MMPSEMRKSDDTRRRPVLLIGGKGGVGKTTCSAAIAVQLASRGLKTLVITSDLTPSLSDVFGRKIGDTITTIDENLHAYEISQEAIASRWKGRFGPDFYDILAHLIEVDALDAESRHQLLDYIGSAPSLREETMLDIIMEMAGTSGYDQVVWDTAPAGETLNLLGMPKNIRKHLRAGAKVFEGLDRIGKRISGKRSIAGIMDEWTALSEKISRFIHEKSMFIIVANPEALVVNQARRLMTTLMEYDLVVHGMIINRVIGHADSASLATIRETQKGYIEELRRIAGNRTVVTLPFSFSEIRGIRQLLDIGERLAAGLSL